MCLPALNTVAFLLCPKLSRKLQSIVLESGLATSPQIELLGEKWLCLVLCILVIHCKWLCLNWCPYTAFVVPRRRSTGYCCVVRYHGRCGGLVYLLIGSFIQLDYEIPIIAEIYAKDQATFLLGAAQELFEILKKIMKY